MKLSSLFRSSPEDQIRKARKRVKEPHGDPATRMNAAAKLLEMGTPEALRALLDRFTITVSPSIQDEEEKKEVVSWIIHAREKAVPALMAFLKEERELYWPAKALRQILPAEPYAEKIADILQHHWDNPPASYDPTAQLIRLLGGVTTPRLVSTVSLFLQEESSDDLRLAAVDFLFEQAEEASREPVLQCYLDSEDRPRVRGHILDCLAQKGWNVKGFRAKIEETLPEGYQMSREGRVKKIGRDR